LARHFLAGVLEHAPALSAFGSPTVNSYKRLVPGTLVPMVANWGWDNRTTYIRVAERNSKSIRLELRAADAAANPYLVTAANLFAGLDGIRRKLEPPPPVLDDSPEGVSLPMRIEDSLQALRQDTYMRDAMGKPLVDAFCALKSMEAARYRQHVSAWELNEYAWHL
jgi:glutamine synthetase